MSEDPRETGDQASKRSPENTFPVIPNIAPKLWGRSAWRTLHAIALTYPDSPSTEQMKAVKDLFYSLVHLLPCTSCRTNLDLELRKLPIENALKSREALNDWLLELHNSVNQRLGAPLLTAKDVVDMIAAGNSSTGSPASGSSSAKTSTTDPSSELKVVSRELRLSKVARPVMGVLGVITLGLLIALIVLCVTKSANRRR
jgi:hypothetical protein